MKVLSIMTHDAPAPGQRPTPELIEDMGKLVEELKSSGVLIDTGGRFPGMLEMQIARKDGKTSITDGPFTEAKEVVGGFALMEVRDRDHAIALTNRFLDLVGDATCHLHEVDLA